MKFNPDLIQKARKGEIAILNDGSVEELRKLVKEVWPYDDESEITEGEATIYFKEPGSSMHWDCSEQIDRTTHSIRDFFMPDIKDKPIFRKENEGHQPRTYKVTRGQMKEIWEAAKDFATDEFIVGLTKNLFGAFSDQEELDEREVKQIVSSFPIQQVPDLIKSIFPSYFHIPEGEAVLCRDNLGSWVIGVSDGKGKAYVTFNYNHAQSYGQIIPFTKNPPQ